MTQIALSILIPNFNYARYIGATIESVLVQATSEHEIVVCDNASTDDSIEVVRRYVDERVRLAVNPCNVGFAANLERVAQLARGRRMLLLSSDDRMKPDAIATYAALERALGPRAERSVWGSSISVIDSNGAVTGHVAPDPKLWRDSPVDPELSARVGYPVRGVPAQDMLRRSLQLLRSPLAFATTCYPRALHDAVGGYSGGRLMNPDKWFLWKLLGEAERIYVIDHPLFEYRVHDGGQAPQEQRSGALKHLTDQYVATFQLSDALLKRAGLTRDELAAAFVEQDVALRGFLALAQGKRLTALRSVHFGIAAYPTQARANLKVWLLRGLLALGPVGTEVARRARGFAEARWTESLKG